MPYDFIPDSHANRPAFFTNLKRQFATSAAALCLVLTAGLVRSHAQDTPSAAAAVSEMQKWIATTDEQWQAVFKRDVTDVHLTELEKLKQQYVAALEAAVTKASSAGDLDGAVALRNEEKRFAGTNLLPEQDEATDSATVKQIRAAVRAQIAKLEKDTAARTKALHAKYDAYLADAQSRLTKAQHLEDALLVKAKRDEVSAAWLTPGIAATAEKPVPPAVKSTPVPVKAPAKVPVVAVAPAKPGVPEIEHGSNWDAMLQNPASVEVADMQAQPLTQGEGKDAWTEVPQKLLASKASIFMPSGKRINFADFTVTADGWLLIAVNYSYQGNKGGGWEEGRWLGNDFKAKGWHLFSKHELGGVLVKGESKGEGKAQEIYGKKVQKGYHERIHCNKYDPPYLILLGGK